MKILLSKQIPAQDGYHLMQFNQVGGLHLVLIQTELDGSRIMYPDDPKHYATFKLDECRKEIYKDAYFTQEPIIIQKV